MARAIWKYTISIADEYTQPMPAGAELLSVGVQNDQPVLWALIDPSPDVPHEPRKICVRGTGHPVGPECGKFVGTFLLLEGRFVGHVFEGTP